MKINVYIMSIFMLSIYNFQTTLLYMNSIVRCDWCGSDPEYIKYHDEEWGKLVTDNHKLFEFLVLESAQAGLSWITILKKREGYRKAFADFDANKISHFDANKIEELTTFDGIIRNRLKIKATVTNAQAFLNILSEFGSFSTYILSFFPNNKPIVNNWQRISEVPASTQISDAISKDMKKRGFKFFGSVICYAFLQATGYVNDHIMDCHCRKK